MTYFFLQIPYIPLISLNLQLNVRKCNECGQPLPESFEPPAVEPWTTGIFACAEDPESCKLFSQTKLLHYTTLHSIYKSHLISLLYCYYMFRLDRTFLSMCSVWAQLWNPKRGLWLYNNSMCSSCNFHWRRSCTCCNNSSIAWSYWPKNIISHLWRAAV